MKKNESRFHSTTSAEPHMYLWCRPVFGCTTRGQVQQAKTCSSGNTSCSYLCAGFNQSGGDLGYVGVFWLFFGLFVVVFLGGGGVVQTVKLAEGCCCFLLLLQMTTGYKIQVLVAAALLLLLSEYKFDVISF